MKIGQYQNIVVININHGEYTNYWVYRADAIDPAKTHGWDSLPLYLSALKQAVQSPECHKRGNGEDHHLYYIPMGDEVNIDKAKQIALKRLSEWEQPWETMPAYVVRFFFKKKQTHPFATEIFRKSSSSPESRKAYLKHYEQSVSQPYVYQKAAGQLVICWQGATLRQITQEVIPQMANYWKQHRKYSWL